MQSWLSAIAAALMLVACASDDRAPAPACFVGGCSHELCSDHPGVVSPCIWRDAYACYRTATCERQADDACGWTATPALAACLAAP